MSGRFGGIPLDMTEVNSGGKKKSGVGRFGGIPIPLTPQQEAPPPVQGPSTVENTPTRLMDRGTPLEQPQVEQPQTEQFTPAVEGALRVGGATDNDLLPVQPVEQTQSAPLDAQQMQDQFGGSGVTRTLIGGGIGGAIGAGVGAVEGIGREVLSGEIGSQGATERIQSLSEERASQGASLLGGTPSKNTQQILQPVAEALQPLQALPGFAPELQQLGRAVSLGVKASDAGAIEKAMVDATRMPKIKNKAREAISNQILSKENPSKLELNILNGIRQAEGNTAFNQRIKLAKKNNISEGTAAAFVGSTKGDKRAMTNMVNQAKAIGVDEVFKTESNPVKALGNTILQRYKAVQGANKRAGARLDSVAKNNLIGQELDASDVKSAFAADIENMGASVNSKGDLTFSDLTPSGTPRTLMSEVWKFIKAADGDAYKLHQAKRAIDEAVTYNKPGEGLSGKTEAIAKNIRVMIDSKLDGSFPEYDKVNTQYSDTIGSMNKFKDAAGGMFHPDEDISADLLGFLGRDLAGKTAKQAILRSAIDDLEQIGSKYGVTFKDDVTTQALFNAELEKAFKIKYETLDEELLRQAPLESARAARGDWKSAVADTMARIIRRSATDESDKKAINALERLVK